MKRKHLKRYLKLSFLGAGHKAVNQTPTFNAAISRNKHEQFFSQLNLETLVPNTGCTVTFVPYEVFQIIRKHFFKTILMVDTFSVMTVILLLSMDQKYFRLCSIRNIPNLEISLLTSMCCVLNYRYFV